MFPAHFICCRLALQVLILRVFLQQAQLLRKGAAGFPMRLSHGPQPGEIQMCVSDSVKHRHRRPVNGLKHRFQHIPCRTVCGHTSLHRLLKINHQGCPFQRLCHMIRTQAFLIQLIPQQHQGIHVHVQLVSLLVPDAIGHVPQYCTLTFRLRIRKRSRQYRTRGTGRHRALRIEVARISLNQEIIRTACLAAVREKIVYNVMVRHLNPLCPPGSERLSIHKHRGLAARLKIHGNPASLRLIRQHDAASHPAVFPCMPPFRSLRHGGISALLRLLWCQVIHCQKGFDFNFAQRHIEIMPECLHPVPQSVLPF